MNKYNTQIEQIKYTQKGKEILMENVKNSNKSKSKVLKIALAIAILSTITATAYATQNPIDILTPIFGNTQAQTEIIGKIGVPINASDTSNGITITAEAIMGNKNNAMIVYKLSNEDGSTIELPTDADKTSLYFNGFSGSNLLNNIGGSYGVRCELYEDGYYRIVEKVTTYGELPNGKNTTAIFTDLSYYNENGIEEILVDSKWKINYKFSYIDSNENIIVDESFSRSGLEFTVKSIDISPISINLNYEVNSVPGFFNREDTTDKSTDETDEVELKENGQTSDLYSQESYLYKDQIEFILITKNGKSYDFTGSAGGLRNNIDHTVGYKNAVFDEIIPLEEIATIQVGDIIIDVNF